jgi:hypothetical protein
MFLRVICEILVDRACAASKDERENVCRCVETDLQVSRFSFCKSSAVFSCQLSVLSTSTYACLPSYPLLNPRSCLQVLAYKLIYKYNIFNAQAGRKVLTRDMTHYGEGHEMLDLKRDDIVQLSYNAKTGKEVGTDLKKHLAGEATGALEGSLVSGLILELGTLLVGDLKS